jgi:DNA-binding response OmpR family regulator
MLFSSQQGGVMEGRSDKIILVVENDDATGELLVLAIMQETPYQVKHISRAREAITLVRTLKPSLLILDYYLSSMTGIQLYDQLHAISGLEHIPAILMSASLECYLDEVERRNMIGLRKPFELDELLNSIEQALS